MRKKILDAIWFAIDFGLPYIGILAMTYLAGVTAVNAIIGYVVGYFMSYYVTELLLAYTKQPKNTAQQDEANQQI
jgi:membrane protein YqaA with SNARE-associated domain